MLSGQIKIIGSYFHACKSGKEDISTLGDLSARPTIIFLNWLISGVQKITTDSTISWMKERGSCSSYSYWTLAFLFSFVAFGFLVLITF